MIDQDVNAKGRPCQYNKVGDAWVLHHRGVPAPQSTGLLSSGLSRHEAKVNVCFFKSSWFWVFCHLLLHQLLVDTRAIYVPSPGLCNGDKMESKIRCSTSHPRASGLQVRDTRKNMCKSEELPHVPGGWITQAWRKVSKEAHISSSLMGERVFQEDER